MKPSKAKFESGPPLHYYLPAVLVLAVLLYPLFRFGAPFALTQISDDAYYYIVIAQNIISSGESSFFPGELTNGYHPLWLAFLVLGGKVFGLSLVSVKVMEAASIFGGFIIFIRFFRFSSFAEVLYYTAFLLLLLFLFALDAMETALLFPTLAFLFVTLLSQERLIAKRRGLLLFFSSALVIGTRLDAAVFVLPLLAVSSLASRQKGMVFIALLGTGLLYAVLNLWIFGTALPISGAIKSWGGLQLNTHYLSQIQNIVGLGGSIRVTPLSLLFFLASFTLSFAVVLRRKGRNLYISGILLAALIGFSVFEAKIIFLSSWVIWRWYNYPLLILFSLLSGRRSMQYAQKREMYRCFFSRRFGVSYF